MKSVQIRSFFLVLIFLYLVRIQENKNQKKKSVFGHFSRSVYYNTILLLHESTVKKFKFTFRWTVLVFITLRNQIENAINILSANTPGNEILYGHYHVFAFSFTDQIYSSVTVSSTKSLDLFCFWKFLISLPSWWKSRGEATNYLQTGEVYK